MKKLSVIILLLSLSILSKAQTVLLNEDFSNGIPSTWTTVDLDQLTPDSTVAFVNNAWVGLTSGFDTCAVSTSFYNVSTSDSSKSEDYLVTPALNLLDFGHIFSWESKSFDANYLETYYVLLSTSNASPQSFTDTIKIVTNDSPSWKSMTINLFSLGYANQSVYIAFKNASTDKYLLGIDNVKLTTNDVASMDDFNELNFSAYPNPVTSVLHTSVSNGKRVELHNIQGKIVLSEIVSSGSINVSNLEAGFYTLSFKENGITYTKKILKL